MSPANRKENCARESALGDDALRAAEALLGVRSAKAFVEEARAVIAAAASVQGKS